MVPVRETDTNVNAAKNVGDFCVVDDVDVSVKDTDTNVNVVENIIDFVVVDNVEVSVTLIKMLMILRIELIFGL